MGWADSLVSGFSTGYSIAQDARDRQQKRKLRDFEIAKEQRAADLQKADDDISKSAASIVKNVGVGLDGDGMGPPTAPQDATSVTVAPAPEAAPAPSASTGPVDNSVLPAAPGETPAQAPVGLPGSSVGVGPGQSRSAAAMEAGGATQAAAGVQPQPEKMPKVEVTAQKKTEKADIYKTKIRLAEEKGLTDLAGKYHKEYGASLVEKVKADDAQWKLENKETLNQIAGAKTAEELKELQMKAQQRQIQAGGTMLYLWQLGMKDQAREVSKHGALGGDGWELGDIRPGANGTLEIVGKDGEVAMSVTPEQARGFVQMSGVAPKDENVVLADGAKLVNKRTGAPVAENVKDPKKDVDRTGTAAREAGGYIDRALGIQRDQMGNLIAGVTPEQVRQSADVQMKAAEYIRQGMAPQEAAAKAIEEYKKHNVKPPAGAAKAPAAQSVPAGYTPPWKKK